MKRARWSLGVGVLACALSLFGGCARDNGPPSDSRDLIQLRWIKAYPGESRGDVETGLLWGLSLAGAENCRAASASSIGKAITSRSTWHAPTRSRELNPRGAISSPRSRPAANTSGTAPSP